MTGSEANYGAKVPVTFGGYSDDIVYLKAPPIGEDEFYAQDGDQIHIRFPSGAKVIVRPEFTDGWHFTIDVPVGTEVEYEHANA